MSGACEEYPSVWREKVRKARKEHKCSACRIIIRVGDFYSNTFCVFEGEPDTIKRCGSCELTYQHLQAICQEHNRLTGDSMAPQADLGCGLRYEEEWGDVPESIAALPFLSADERSALLAPRSV